MVVLDKELLPARPFRDRGFSVRKFHVDKSSPLQELRGPREDRHRIFDVLQDLVESNRIVASKILRCRKISANSGDADIFLRVLNRSGIRIQGRALPTRAFHAIKKNTKPGTDIKDRGFPVFKTLWRKKTSREFTNAANTTRIVGPRVIQGIDLCKRLQDPLFIPVSGVDILAVVKRGLVHAMRGNKMPAVLAAKNFPGIAASF